MNEKVTRLRSSTLTVGNLAMIFKLDINQGIYTCCEEGEIIIPTETDFFNIEDYAKTYVVNGEPTRPASSRTNYLRHVIRLESPVLPENSLLENKSKPTTWPDVQYANLATAEILLWLEKSGTIIMEEVGCSRGRAIIWRNKREISSSFEFDRRNRVGG